MKKLGLLLIEIGQEERQVDIMRQVLSEQSNFSTYNLFRYITSNNINGSIGAKEVIYFMKKNKILHNKFEVDCLIKSLDKDGDGSIGYADFLSFVKFANSSSSKSITMKGEKDAKQTPVTSRIGVDVEYAFSRLIERELELHRKIESIKINLAKSSEIKLEESYFYIVPSNCIKQGFTQKNLKHFLVKECGFDVLEDEIKAVMKRLDRDQDGIISCKDFALTILPLHLSKESQINWMESYLLKLTSANKNCDDVSSERKDNKSEEFYKTCCINPENLEIKSKGMKPIVMKSCLTSKSQTTLGTTHDQSNFYK